MYHVILEEILSSVYHEERHIFMLAQKTHVAT